MFYTFIRKLVLLAKEKGIRRSLNFLLLEISNTLQLAHVWGQPIFIQIEPTTYCNSKCVMCGRTHTLKKGILKPKHMKFEDFKKIMLKLPYCHLVHLHGLGEPLLNPDLLKMIRFCKERKIHVGFTTNAAVLSEEAGKGLILSGLDHIGFSIDSADAETFEKIRKGSRFSTVIKNIKRFIELKNELKSETPTIRAKAIVSKENIYKIPHLLDLIKSMGIKKVILNELMFVKSKQLHTLSNISKEQLSLLPKYKSYGHSLGLEVELLFFAGLPPLSNRKRVGCWKLWKSMYITVEGGVTPCCYVTSEKVLTYGNILKQDFKDIWNNKLYKCSRIMLKGNGPCFPCKTCQRCIRVKLKNET